MSFSHIHGKRPTETVCDDWHANTCTNAQSFSYIHGKCPTKTVYDDWHMPTHTHKLPEWVSAIFVVSVPLKQSVTTDMPTHAQMHRVAAIFTVSVPLKQSVMTDLCQHKQKRTEWVSAVFMVSVPLKQPQESKNLTWVSRLLIFSSVTELWDFVLLFSAFSSLSDDCSRSW